MTETLVQGVLLPWLNAFVLALLPILGTLALLLLRKHGVDTTWFEAIGRAGGASYASLVASGKPVTDKGALIAAAEVGAAYLQQRVPGIVASKGLDASGLAQIAGAELGKVLGVDPTTAPGSAAVTANVGAGQTAIVSVEASDTAPVARALGMLAILAAAFNLSACTSAQVGRTVAEGQLVCAVGPTVVAMADPAGAAVLAKGSTKSYVDAACAVIGGIAVSPPGAPVPTVTIVPPPVTVPLKVTP